jgi:hypothetical protein
MGVGGQLHAPAAFAPGKYKLLIVQEAGWAPGPVWAGCGKSRPTPGFDPRNFQPVASRYTDWAIAASRWKYKLKHNAKLYYLID